MTVQRVTPTATAMVSHDALSARIRLILASWAAVQTILLGISTSSVGNISRTKGQLFLVSQSVNYNNIPRALPRGMFRPTRPQGADFNGRDDKALDQLVGLS
jgi:hypothetical protein